MTTDLLTLSEAVALAFESDVAITNTYLFNERHSYLKVQDTCNTIKQIFYEESKGSWERTDSGSTFIDATTDNLSIAFCPTPNDLVERGWWVLKVIRPDAEASL